MFQQTRNVVRLELHRSERIFSVPCRSSMPPPHFTLYPFCIESVNKPELQEIIHGKTFVCVVCLKFFKVCEITEDSSKSLDVHVNAFKL